MQEAGRHSQDTEDNHPLNGDCLGKAESYLEQIHLFEL